MSMRDVFESTLSDIEARVGTSLKIERAKLAALMEREALDLQSMQHEPGFEGALLRSRDIIAMEAGMSTDEVTDAVRGERLGLIFSALRIGALFLA